MADHNEVSSSQLDRISGAITSCETPALFLGQIIQMRLEVPSVMPVEDLSDDVIIAEMKIREARIKEDEIQLSRLHLEIRRRKEANENKTT